MNIPESPVWCLMIQYPYFFDTASFRQPPSTWCLSEVVAAPRLVCRACTTYICMCVCVYTSILQPHSRPPSSSYLPHESDESNHLHAQRIKSNDGSRTLSSAIFTPSAGVTPEQYQEKRLYLALYHFPPVFRFSSITSRARLVFPSSTVERFSTHVFLRKSSSLLWGTM